MSCLRTRVRTCVCVSKVGPPLPDPDMTTGEREVSGTERTETTGKDRPSVRETEGMRLILLFPSK